MMRSDDPARRGGRTSRDDEVRDQAQLVAHWHEAGQRLPGTAYYGVLGWVHDAVRPATYLEIGVHKGRSLRESRYAERCIGIDPAPSIEGDVPADCTIYELTSDAFFARHDPRRLLGAPVEFAFIDGLHLFEQVLRDFVNVERHVAARGVIALHDCIPLDAITSSRDRTTDFYSGDVWKASLALQRLRPDLAMAIVPAAPTGLCLVKGFARRDDCFERELPSIEAEYRNLDFEYYVRHRNEMPEEIRNEEDAVRDWLAAPERL